MTTTITPAEVTMEMLRSGVESNETKKHLPSRFEMIDKSVNYWVKFWDGWQYIETISIDEVARYMRSDSGDDTVWTTPIEEGK